MPCSGLGICSTVRLDGLCSFSFQSVFRLEQAIPTSGNICNSPRAPCAVRADVLSSDIRRSPIRHFSPLVALVWGIALDDRSIESFDLDGHFIGATSILAVELRLAALLCAVIASGTTRLAGARGGNRSSVRCSRCVLSRASCDGLYTAMLVTC